MPSNTPDTPDRDIMNEAEFGSALETLLLTALNNGLNPEGAWEYRNGKTYPDLEVLITELAK